MENNAEKIGSEKAPAITDRALELDTGQAEANLNEKEKRKAAKEEDKAFTDKKRRQRLKNNDLRAQTIL